jgi:hypothetical protein
LTPPGKARHNALSVALCCAPPKFLDKNMYAYYHIVLIDT